jgi:N-glycosidase YbiA
VKDDIMRRAVRRKFETHEDIRRILLSTGNEELIEQTTDDYYWGCGTNGTGANMLGKILMEVRAEMRET